MTDFETFQQKLAQKAKNDTMNNPAHYNNFPGFYFLIFDPSSWWHQRIYILIHFIGSNDQTLIHISDLVAAIQNSQKKNQDPFNPAKEVLF